MSGQFRMAWVGWVAACLLLAGCAGDGGGAVRVVSQSHPDLRLQGRFDRGLYRFDDRDHATVVLLEGPAESPRQVVTIRLFWTPKAGRTPADRTATNATIHYVIFAGEDGAQPGVYSGAGFVFADNRLGADPFRATVRQAMLRLSDRGEQFEDRLGQAMLKGKFIAQRDDQGVQEVLETVNKRLAERLGYPRFVQAEPGRVLASGR